MDECGRWTLDGAQGKIALARIDDTWHVCHGSAATTHIVKPGVEGLTLQSLDEYLCMKLARACGLKAAAVSYEEFDGVPAIVVERYDHTLQTNGTLARIHQEDLCQALGYLSKDKYVPTLADIPSLLKSDASDQSVYDFVSALFFNYLIGATDAHAKNYSLIHLVGQGCSLAPIYDVASILPYQKEGKGTRGAAMPIGREKRFGRLAGSNIERFATNNGLEIDWCRELMVSLAERVCDAVHSVVEDNRHIVGVERIGPALIRTISANCKAMLSNMDANGKTLDTSQFALIGSGDIKRGGHGV